MSIFIGLIGIFVYLSVLAAKRASLDVWGVAGFALLTLATLIADVQGLTLGIIWTIAVLIFILLRVQWVRQLLLSRWMLKYYLRVKPSLSATEAEAIRAGTVGWDAQIFMGHPDWQQLFNYRAPALSEAEQAFIDGPVNALCAMLDDWDICHNRADLPPAVWQFIREQGFLGLIIPESYGGKGFSAYAHSQIITKIASVSMTAGVFVSVPNSLGPAELLVRYGTDAQKDYYLPRLAQGIDIPCFALTGPTAGSDATSMPDKGMICQGQFEGKSTLGIKLNWDKRYISLAPIATVIGLAFKLYDPDHLLGDKTDLGITCALIPADLKGITIGRRHLPTAVPFQNGPTQGRDVFIPLDWIIGGIDMAGQGWRMLAECLAAGRSISLPSAGVGSSEMALAATSAYVAIRQQFKQPIGHYEGIQSVLGRMVGLTYIANAARLLTMSMIDAGEHPSVISGIMKYHATEIGREVVTHAMDIHAGKGICMGPRNYLARMFMASPISITVEGANILTRNMIIFGQGAIRCHPFALQEMELVNLTDKKAQLAAFDELVFQHLGFTWQNGFASFGYAISGGRWIGATHGPLHRYLQQYTRLSTAFAFAVDIAMLGLGADLKRREGISARFADALSYLYLASAVMKYHYDKQFLAEDKPVFTWAMEHLFAKTAAALEGIVRNFPHPWLRYKLRGAIFPFGNHFAPPKDALTFQLAEWIQIPSSSRDQLIADAYLEPTLFNWVGKMQDVLVRQDKLALLESQLKRFIKQHKLGKESYQAQLNAAVAESWLTEDEALQLKQLEQDRQQIIAVDDFAAEELTREIHLVDTEGHFITSPVMAKPE